MEKFCPRLFSNHVWYSEQLWEIKIKHFTGMESVLLPDQNNEDNVSVHSKVWAGRSMIHLYDWRFPKLGISPP